MKNLCLTLLVLSFSLSLFASDDKCKLITNDKLCVQITWVDGPYIGAYSKNIVKFKDLTASKQTGKDIYRSPSEHVQFFGLMKMATHEHGTREVDTKPLESGVYENSKIFYMGGMKGTWKFMLKLGASEFLLHTFDI